MGFDEQGEVQVPPTQKSRVPSSSGWLWIFLVGAIAGTLSARLNSPLFMLVGIVVMFVIFQKMNASNIKPKKLSSAKPKKFDK